MLNSKPRYIIVVFDKKLLPIRHGNQARVVRLIAGLKEYGYKVILVGNVNDETVMSTEAQRAELEGLVRPIVDVFIPVCGPSFDGFIYSYDISAYVVATEQAATCYKPIAIIVEYFWMSGCFDAVDHGVLKIIDTHDVMCRREVVYRPEGVDPWISVEESYEAELLSKAEVIIGIQENETDILRKLLPGKNVITLMHSPGYVIAPSNTYIRKRVMVFGSNNASNRHGMALFLQKSWPRLLNLDSEIRLDVVGGLSAIVEGSRTTRLAYVEDPREAYSTAHLILNTTVLGTGLKIKTVEALCNSKAVITAPSGAEGLEGAGFPIARSWKEFTHLAAEVTSSLSLTRELQERAYEFAKANLSTEAVFGELISQLHDG